MSKGLKYVGGEGLRLAGGIPAGDLTPEEVEKYGRRWLLSLRVDGKPLFKEVSVPRKKKEDEAEVIEDA